MAVDFTAKFDSLNVVHWLQMMKITLQNRPDLHHLKISNEKVIKHRLQSRYQTRTCLLIALWPLWVGGRITQQGRSTNMQRRCLTIWTIRACVIIQP